MTAVGQPRPIDTPPAAACPLRAPKATERSAASTAALFDQQRR